MKRFIIGVAVGAFAVTATIIALMFTGSPFRAVPCTYGPYGHGMFVSTPVFLVVYEEGGSTAGGDNMTFSGKHGVIPAFWRGYGGGAGGGATGFDALRTYEPASGTATLFLAGRLIMVEEDGKYLRVQNLRVPFDGEKVAIVVDKGGIARRLDAREAAEVEGRLDRQLAGGRMVCPPRGR